MLKTDIAYKGIVEQWNGWVYKQWDGWILKQRDEWTFKQWDWETPVIFYYNYVKYLHKYFLNNFFLNQLLDF